MPPEPTLNPLAQGLNDRLAAAAPEVLEMLSGLGRRMYFPKGILAQTAEAKEKAHRFNATIGIATESGGPMVLPSLTRHLVDVEPSEAFTYAPPAGRLSLRQRWREKALEENPSLRGKRFGLPIATSAITHGLELVGDLFLDPGDAVVIPDKLWGNYRLAYEVRRGAVFRTFPFYSDGGLNTAGFAAALEQAAQQHGKLLALLNFPNNPTGYVPSPAEAEALVRTLEGCAAGGARVVAVLDDAYHGLFYHLGGESITESLFGPLANLHPNLLAVRLDGATKELFAWGLRCGFLTFGPGRAEGAEEVCEVLDAKVRGLIRSGISNASHLAQSLVEKALAAPELGAERAAKRETLRARAQRVYEVARLPRFRESWEVYPFNSGYFMCIAVKGVEAEKLRLHLLERYGIGLISTSATDLRIAFSCLEVEEVEPLFETLHEAIQELQ